MNGSLKKEALKAIETEIIERTEKATGVMRKLVPQAGENPWSTGNLAASIRNERTGKWSWRIGSPLEYASYVNDGRGAVYPNYDNPAHAIFLKGLNIWARHAEPAPAQHFIEYTAREF